jgi:tetratricopeptide (TPR) repeat protein
MSRVKPTPDQSERLEREDRFMANLRQALEHVGDEEWLDKHAPLKPSVELANTSADIPTAAGTPVTGLKWLDERLAAIRKDWESRPKSGLQALLWSAVNKVAPDKDVNYAALLTLTYFQDPRPKQSDLIKQLAMGQSTFYRHLNTAVEALERTLLAEMRPSLRLEAPARKPLIGRDDVLRDCLAALSSGGVVSIVGGSGLGKTSLGAALCQAWTTAEPTNNRQSEIQNRKFFWYTFRAGLTDNVQHLIFSLALFLHHRGISHLWQHLLASPNDVSMAKALAVIRKSFEDLRDAPALLCFDEADLLLPNELDDAGKHEQLRSALEELIEAPRHGTAILLIGQRLLAEPERGHVFTLTRFDASAIRDLFQRAGLPHDDDACATAGAYTRGNPLLLQLLITLHRVGEPVLADPSRVAGAATLDWFLTRVRRRLSAREQDLLDAMCVFDVPVPAHVWRAQAKPLDKLVQLNLVERDAAGQVGMPMALRDGLYRRLPPDLRAALHVSAAQACVDLGAFTLAARHFALGQQHGMAIWTWQAHADDEIRHGQAQTALAIFEPLRYAPLDSNTDRQALALILAQLNSLNGKLDTGLSALDAVSWPPGRLSSTRANALRGRLLAQRGDIDAALAAYRAGLDSLTMLRLTQPVTLRTELALQTLERARDVPAARREAHVAQADLDIVRGYIEELNGQMDAAQHYFASARDVLREGEVNDPVRLAKVHEALGLNEARRLNVEAAVGYLQEAGRHYHAYGNLICAAGMTDTNIAFAYLLARHYEQAVAPAQRAVDFFLDSQQPYFLANSEACLAEVLANLGRLQEAEALVWRALAHEEASARPYALYVLGHIRRQQKRFVEAEQLCAESLDGAKAGGDLWNIAFAQRVLGEVYHDWGKPDAARAAFAHACEAFTKLGLQADADELREQISMLDMNVIASPID